MKFTRKRQYCHLFLANDEKLLCLSSGVFLVYAINLSIGSVLPQSNDKKRGLVCQCLDRHISLLRKATGVECGNPSFANHLESQKFTRAMI